MVYIGTRTYKYGRMRMSHMMADTPKELHEMADRIGVARRHYQALAKRPHYDVCQQKKKLAIEKFGAKLVDDRKMIILFNSRAKLVAIL